jgi:SAM-dependent methyltransferase
MLSSTSPGQRVLEIGGGTGEISLHLANAGRIVSVLDIDQDSLDFVRSCAGDLGLSVDTIRSDATVPLAMTDGQFDCVWSAGLLEHFTAAERIPILKEWARITTDALIILVPNASCLPYKIWKQREESAGTWPYGIETPVVSLQKELLAAGMARVEEFSVGIRHALSFLPPRDPLRKALEALAKDRASDWMQESNQGYLLVTVGRKTP